MDTADINHPISKGLTALTAFVAMDWLTKAGQVCAALTAIVIFGEIVWKKLLKPLIRRLRKEPQ